MAKATALTFAVQHTLAQEVPFCVSEYVQHILHELTSILLCVPFIFADCGKKSQSFGQM